MVGRRVVRGQVQYRVRWQGHTEAEDTWETRDSLAVDGELAAGVAQDADLQDGRAAILEVEVLQEKLQQAALQLHRATVAQETAENAAASWRQNWKVSLVRFFDSATSVLTLHLTF